MMQPALLGTGRPRAIELPGYWLREAKRCLNRSFQKTAFRGKQIEVIQAALEGRDVFVLWPTGSGKSLCYQLPAVYESLQHGITVVISPLKALISDQCSSLARTDIYVVRFSGDQSSEERMTMFRKLFLATSCMLYVTPEMFFGIACQNAISELYAQNRLARFVVDEAHCILEYGESFRKDYRRLSMLKQTYPKVPIMALTATANPEVMEETIKTLQIENCFISRQPMDRSNLRYSVLWRSPGQTSMKAIFPIISRHEGSSGIVYCHTTSTCEWLATKLKERDIKAEGFHASLYPAEKSTRYGRWLRGETQILVATIALGMGVDHPSIRFVIHWDLPRSIDAYIQESGRAGRDGLPADCVMFFMPRLWVKVFSSTLNSLSRDRSLNIVERRLAEKLAEKQIRSVNSYAMSKLCRHQFLLDYMGERSIRSTCRPKVCDACVRPSQPVDMSTRARNMLRLLTAAIRKLQTPRGSLFRSRFITACKLANIYRGKSEADKVFNDLKLFGIGAKQSIAQVEFFIASLVELEILSEKPQLCHRGQERDDRIIFIIEPGKHADDVLSLRQDVFIDFPRQVMPGGRQNQLVIWHDEEYASEPESNEENEDMDMEDGSGRESPEL